MSRKSHPKNSWHGPPSRLLDRRAMIVGPTAAFAGALLAWWNLSEESVNDLAEQIAQDKINGAKKEIDLHLHPDATRLITVVRQRHLDLFVESHKELIFDPQTKHIQDDIALIVEDLHVRYGLVSVVCEGLNEKGRDSGVETLKEDIIMLQQLGITDDPSFFGRMLQLQDPELLVILLKAPNAQKIFHDLARIRDEVQKAGSFDQWKRQVIENAGRMAQEYDGAKRMAAKGVIRLLPGEHSSIQRELLLALLQKKSKEEINAITFHRREKHAFSQAASGERHTGIVYGKLHEWKDDADAHNAQNPHQAVSLAIVTPESLPE